MTVSRAVDHELEGKPHEGFLVHDGSGRARPTVLVFHAWDGRSEAMNQTAERIAGLGYNAYAVDLYGKGRTGTTPEECQALMNPLIGDRTRLRALLLAAIEVASAQSEVDAERLAAIGFCFGGLCVLDCARAGAPLKGVASIHGIFNPAGLASVTPIQTRVIAFHGWDDPMAPPQSVVEFGKEFTEGGADWQLHGFGHTLHAFTVEAANDPAMGVKYNADAARRTWAGMTAFLAEVLGG
jgi:dienelactone hydrolase